MGYDLPSASIFRTWIDIRMFFLNCIDYVDKMKSDQKNFYFKKLEE